MIKAVKIINQVIMRNMLHKKTKLKQTLTLNKVLQESQKVNLTEVMLKQSKRKSQKSLK